VRHFLRLLLVSCAFAAGCAGETARSPTSPTMGALAQTQAQVAPAEPQSAAPAPQAQSGAELPFRGSLDSTETATGSFPIVSVELHGTGHATHLGRFTTTFLFQVDLSTSMGSGTFVLRAANGDQVLGTETGQATVTGGVASIVENAIITGGTGRFAGATGSFTIERALVQATGISSGSFTGTITLAH
jgi:hypothetical protein